MRVSADGTGLRELTRLTPPNQISHRFPYFLPDGRHFIFFALGPLEQRGVYLGALDSPDVQRVLDGDVPATPLPPDSILFMRDGALLSRRLNLATRALEGEPAPAVHHDAGWTTVPAVAGCRRSDARHAAPELGRAAELIPRSRRAGASRTGCDCRRDCRFGRRSARTCSPARTAAETRRPRGWRDAANRTLTPRPPYAERSSARCSSPDRSRAASPCRRSAP